MNLNYKQLASWALNNHPILQHLILSVDELARMLPADPDLCNLLIRHGYIP